MESNTERKAFLVLRARLDVAIIEDQPPAIRYLDACGQESDHTFDLRVTKVDGEKIAVAVRPEEKAAGLRTQLALIGTQMSRNYADRIKLITDRDLPVDLVYNANLIQSARLYPNLEMDQQVRKVIANTQGAIKIEDIVAQIDRTGEAFRAIVHLIALGELKVVDSLRITHNSRVALVGNQGGAK